MKVHWQQGSRATIQPGYQAAGFFVTPENSPKEPRSTGSKGNAAAQTTVWIAPSNTSSAFGPQAGQKKSCKFTFPGRFAAGRSLLDSMQT
eukprot:1153942-Pelagomonas_calceolata.AAC.4